MYTKIVLSGKRCTGKTTLFWNLQSQLGWPMFSVSQYLRDYIRTYHVSPLDVEASSREITADIDRRIQGLLEGPNQVIIEARVFHGLKQSTPGVIKVLLTASDNIRVQRSSLREQTTIQKAHHKLIKKEDEWTHRMGQLYQISDLFNTQYYDLVIDTDDKTPEEVVSIVTNKVNNS